MKGKVLFALVALTGFGCYHMPPAHRMVEPGPGVGGPGPGVLGGVALRRFPTMQTQVRFVGNPGMHIGWQVATAEGMATFADQVEVPGRYNFAQGMIYQLKVTDIPDRAGIELYPTLEIAPSSPQSDAYLAHNTVPVQFTDEDFDQVLSGNMVTKVVYLPDAEYQELAIAGVETLVSTRLEPGVDPILEADRRGNILAIVRMGGIDRELPGETADGGAMMLGPNGAIVPVSAMMPMGPGGIPMSAVPGAPMGTPIATGPTGFVAGGGISPAWGMPITGTPIGLPGPPYIPFGAPAGLKSHTIRDHTQNSLAQNVGLVAEKAAQTTVRAAAVPPHVLFDDGIPEPVEHVNIDVHHSPRVQIPEPVSNVEIHEHAY
jgi:hypothetical protein